MVLALGEFDFACSLVRLSLADKKVMAEATQLRLLLITLILVVSWCDGIGIGRRLKFRTCPDRACHNKIDKICRRSEAPSAAGTASKSTKMKSHAASFQSSHRTWTHSRGPTSPPSPRSDTSPAVRITSPWTSS